MTEWYVILTENGEDCGDTPRGPFPTSGAAGFAADYANEDNGDDEDWRWVVIEGKDL